MTSYRTGTYGNTVVHQDNSILYTKMSGQVPSDYYNKIPFPENLATLVRSIGVIVGERT